MFGIGNSNEIKINSEDVDLAIQELTEVKDNLIQDYQEIANQNEALVGRWKGESGDSFVQAALTVEKRYMDSFGELEHQIQNLLAIWKGMNELDQALAKGITATAQPALDYKSSEE